MRAYFRPSRAHKVTLHLTAEEANALLDELDALPIKADTRHLFKAYRMVGRAVDEMEESTR